MELQKQESEQNKKYPLTEVLMILYETLNNLTEAKNMAFKRRSFWNNLDADLIITISRAHGEAKASFWSKAYQIYPEIKGKDVAANSVEISVIN